MITFALTDAHSVSRESIKYLAALALLDDKNALYTRSQFAYLVVAESVLEFVRTAESNKLNIISKHYLESLCVSVSCTNEHQRNSARSRARSYMRMLDIVTKLDVDTYNVNRDSVNYQLITKCL
jgi:hypothetical protein